jgi:hypothetical protein
VADDEVTRRRRAGSGDQVAATTHRALRVGRVPDLLHGRSEEREGIDAGRLGAPVEFLDQPGQPRFGERAELSRQSELLLTRPTRWDVGEG